MDEIRLSICIPTFNRPKMLAKTLEHLVSMERCDAEIVVTDNGDDDAARDVVDSFSGRARGPIVFLKNPTNIGYQANVDRALRAGRGQALYCLSDDDLVYEDALLYMLKILDKEAGIVAVYGRYRGVAEMRVGVNDFPSTRKVFRFARDNEVAMRSLRDNLSIIDGYPMMRRDVFQRFCFLDDSSFGLGRLAAALLRKGDLCFVDAPFFDHLANADSLSARLAEPWMHDFVASDIEVMVGDILPCEPQELDRVKRQICADVYLQGARFAGNSAAFLRMRHYVQRASAYGRFSPSDLEYWDRRFAIPCAAERVAARVVAIGAQKIDAAEDDVCLALASLAGARLGPKAAPREGAALELVRRHSDGARNAGDDRTMAAEDVVASCRLSHETMTLSVVGGKLELGRDGEPLPEPGEAMRAMLTRWGA